MDAAANLTIAGKHEIKPEWLTASKSFEIKVNPTAPPQYRFYCIQKPTGGCRQKSSKRATARLQRHLIRSLVADGKL